MPTDVERTAAKFAARHIEKVALPCDHQPRFPDEVFALGIEAGFDRFVLPETAGGSGFDHAALCALIKTLAQTCAGHAMIFGVHAAALSAIASTGNRELVQLLLESHEPVGVVGPMPVSPDGCAPGNLAINARTSGFVVVCGNAPDGVPQADLIEQPVLGPVEWTLGLRAMPVCTTTSEIATGTRGVRTIAGGPEYRAFYRSLLRNLCLVTSAAAAGVMGASCRSALAYSADRYQGGKTIIDHSHLRAILGGMDAAVAASDGALAQAAARPEDDRAVLGTKVVVTDHAVRVCTDAVQVLGGYGYMREYGLEKAMRDAAMLSLLPLSNSVAELLLVTRP